MLFEEELNHWGKGLTGIELSNSLAHDEIVMIRAIEQNKEKIVRDSYLLFPGKFTIAKKLHIYRAYCSTCCETEVNEKGQVVDLPNVSTTLIGEAVDLAFLHS